MRVTSILFFSVLLLKIGIKHHPKSWRRSLLHFSLLHHLMSIHLLRYHLLNLFKRWVSFSKDIRVPCLLSILHILWGRPWVPIWCWVLSLGINYCFLVGCHVQIFNNIYSQPFIVPLSSLIVKSILFLLLIIKVFVLNLLNCGGLRKLVYIGGGGIITIDQF